MEKIDKLKSKLNLMIEKNENLENPEIIKLSQDLDGYIAEEQRKRLLNTFKYE